MKAVDYIARYLEHRGVSHVFELVGGMITFMVDALNERSEIKVVSMHHEQGAGFAAEGYARMRGVPGVAMATSGPGATNLLTAIGSCYFDSVPAVFITGQVNRHEMKGSRGIRQLGFQETDIVSVVRPVTKAAWLVTDPRLLPELMENAFELALSGRPGPVLLDIPMDVQRAEIDDTSRLGRASEPTAPMSESAAIASFWTAFQGSLANASRPLVLAGGGIASARAIASFRQFAEALQIPVVNSLMAVDVLPMVHPLRVGLIGSYGNRWANQALSECDLLLVVGSRLDIRQTGANTEAFSRGRTIFHVDCEPGEINNRVVGCIPLVTQLRAVFDHICPSIRRPERWKPWLERIVELKRCWPDIGELRDLVGINPNVFMHALSATSQLATAYVVDVGQHQMWAAQSLDLGPNQRMFTSGGMGAMGFALPAGIGACFAADTKPIVVIAGDGGFQLNIQELQTIARNQLPLKLVVLNNHCHGMVRQFQESYFKGRYHSTLWGYSAPNFAAVAQAYGLPAMHVSDPPAVPAALEALWAHPTRPFLLEVAIPTTANAYPKMAFGRSISDMEPLAKPIDMEGT